MYILRRINSGELNLLTTYFLQKTSIPTTYPRGLRDIILSSQSLDTLAIDPRVGTHKQRWISVENSHFKKLNWKKQEVTLFLFTFILLTHIKD